MNPLSFYKCLSDDTRLKSLLLVTLKGELCVCDLINGLELSQPKVSRHLAELRRCGLLVDERRGKWVYYHLNNGLPDWALQVLHATANHNADYLSDCLTRLDAASNNQACC